MSVLYSNLRFGGVLSHDGHFFGFLYIRGDGNVLDGDHALAGIRRHLHGAECRLWDGIKTVDHLYLKFRGMHFLFRHMLKELPNLSHFTCGKVCVGHLDLELGRLGIGHSLIINIKVIRCLKGKQWPLTSFGTYVISVVALPFASITPEFGLTTKQSGCVVLILKAMLRLGDVFAISSLPRFSPFTNIIALSGVKVTNSRTLVIIERVEYC